LKKSPCKL
jgi:hypothetical protein